MPSLKTSLKIAVLTAEPERFRGALTLAAAQAALGGEVAMFLQLDAVALLRPPVAAAQDAAHAAAGLPTLAQLLDDAMELGVAISVCQSGLALVRLSAADLDSRISVTGPVAWLKQKNDIDQLLMS